MREGKQMGLVARGEITNAYPILTSNLEWKERLGDLEVDHHMAVQPKSGSDLPCLGFRNSNLFTGRDC
jgi:hypothetical protein